MFLLVSIGTAFWLSNIGFHLFGNPEIRWGRKVFDSPDHWLSFLASRLHLAHSDDADHTFRFDGDHHSE
jgi:hypothetical protein